MIGTILNFSVQDNSGIISGDDGNRYSFTGSDWRDAVNPSNGMRVDFEPQEGFAVAIYRAPGSAGGSLSTELLSGEKNKVVAGILGIFLGWLGIHKFYLGITSSGRIQAAGEGRPSCSPSSCPRYSGSPW